MKVLFITGYTTDILLDQGHLGPGMHVMTKPFELAVLATRINELIAIPAA